MGRKLPNIQPGREWERSTEHKPIRIRHFQFIEIMIKSMLCRAWCNSGGSGGVAGLGWKIIRVCLAASRYAAAYALPQTTANVTDTTLRLIHFPGPLFKHYECQECATPKASEQCPGHTAIAVCESIQRYQARGPLTSPGACSGSCR